MRKFHRISIIFSRALFIVLSGSDSTWATELSSKGAQLEISEKSQESYSLSLKANDYISIGIEPKSSIVHVEVRDPKNRRVTRVLGIKQSTSIDFHADAAGLFKLNIIGVQQGSLKLHIKEKLSLQEKTRLQPNDLDDVQSPFVQELLRKFKRNSSSEVSQFWRALQGKTTPLIESIEGEPQKSLVTFFWRGSVITRNVVVMLWPYTPFYLDDYKLRNISKTDIWYKTVLLRSDTRTIYQLAENVPEKTTLKNRDKLYSALQVDPLNPKFFVWDPTDDEPSKYQKVSVLELPDAVAQPWIKESQTVPKGTVENRTFKSTLLKNERTVSVYLPPNYDKNSKPYSVFLLFDRAAYLKIVPTPTIVDNLIAAKKIPPIVVALIDFPNSSNDARREELSCNKSFTYFMRDELFPWLKENFNVTLDANQLVVGGSSLGGLAATCAAFQAPDTFRNVLSQSGSYWWKPAPAEGEVSSEANYLAIQFAQQKKLPIRFYLDAGLRELDLEGNGHMILIPNRTFKNVLLAKGYDIHYQEFSGGHDYLSWRGTLADGLIFLMGVH